MTETSFLLIVPFLASMTDIPCCRVPAQLSMAYKEISPFPASLALRCGALPAITASGALLLCSTPVPPATLAMPLPLAPHHGMAPHMCHTATPCAETYRLDGVRLATAVSTYAAPRVRLCSRCGDELRLDADGCCEATRENLPQTCLLPLPPPARARPDYDYIYWTTEPKPRNAHRRQKSPAAIAVGGNGRVEAGGGLACWVGLLSLS